MQLPLEPQKALDSTYKIVVPKTYKHSLMWKYGGVTL